MHRLVAQCIAHLLGLLCGASVAIIGRRDSDFCRVEWRPKPEVAPISIRVKSIGGIVVCWATVSSPGSTIGAQRSYDLHCDLELADPKSLDVLCLFISEYIERQTAADLEIYYAA